MIRLTPDTKQVQQAIGSHDAKKTQGTRNGSGFASTMQSTLQTGPNSPNLPDQINPFSPTAFENRMNTWLISITQQMNTRAMDNYNQAMSDWKLNDTRYRQLGIPSPPPPQPPKLETAEAKPSGWWFRTDLS